MISGTTKLIAHLGFPTETFKAPMIYNPYFEKHGIDAVVVPMGCKAGDYAQFLRLVFKLSNIHGALVTMPHKVTTVALLDEASTTVKVAGSCNAVRLGANGALVGDMFDGEGFVHQPHDGCIQAAAFAFRGIVGVEAPHFGVERRRHSQSGRRDRAFAGFARDGELFLGHLAGLRFTLAK